MAISLDSIKMIGTWVETAETLGKLIRARRKALGYTQEDVADALGFSPRLVGEIERGRGTVGFEKILSYATAMGIDLIAFQR